MSVRDFPPRPQGATPDSVPYQNWLDALGNRQNIDLQQELTSVDSADEVMIFDASETGMVKTKKATVSAIRGGFISVKDFGAVGDGVTDDSAAIQKAIDEVGAAGGGIINGAGLHCVVNSNVVCDFDNVLIYNPTGLFERTSTTNGFMFQWAKNANTTGGGFIGRLKGLATVASGNGGIVMGDTAEVYTADNWVLDVEASNFSQYGVGVEAGDNWRIKNVRVLEHGLTSGVMSSCIGFYVFPGTTASSGGVIESAYAALSSAAQANASLNSAAIKLQCHQGLSASNIHGVAGSESCIVIDSITGIVSNVIVEPQGNDSGLSLTNFNAAHSFSGQAYTVDGVEILGSGTFGLVIGGGDGTNYSLKGCTVRNVRGKNARLASLADAAMQDCIFENWSASDIRLSPAFLGFAVSAALDTGNVFRDIVATGGTQTGVLAIQATESIIENCGITSVTGDTVSTIDITGSDNLIIKPFANDAASNAIKVNGDGNTIIGPDYRGITGRSIWFPSGSDNNIVYGGAQLASAGTGILDSGSGNKFFGIAPTVSSDHGNNDFAINVTSGDTTHIWNTVLTANRAATLSTSSVPEGARIRIIRGASATGAFNLNVGTGPLKALASASTWCDVEFDGSAWFLAAAGSL